MNSKDRILTTFNHEEPDHVPLFELSIESLDVAKGYGESKVASIYNLDIDTLVNLSSKIGLDLITIPVCGLPIGKGTGFGKTKPGLKTPTWSNMVDEFGRILSYNIPNIPSYVGGLFDSETGDLDEIIAKYEKWPQLEANAKLRYRIFERALKAAEAKGLYIVPMMQGYLEHLWQPFGFENFIRLLFEKINFFNAVLKNIDDFLTELVENLIEKYSIELLIYGDDYGYKTGPLLNPKTFENLIFPRIKSFVKLTHKNNVKVLFHSCGNLNKILDKIIETGIDALHPLEPSAAMDIFQIKKDYGKKLTLIGNLDTTDLLARGTPKQVEEQVKKLIKFCAPGGGYIVSSGHSINPSIPFDNYNAMIETTKKYGKYPILISD